MLAAFDTETRGLFGDIFRMGYYDKQNGYKAFYNAEEFIEHIYKIESNLQEITVIKRKKEVTVLDTLYIYAFNLEFDLSKILSEFRKKNIPFQIDFDKTLIINGVFHTAKIKDRNIVFCDLYPIVGSSLDKAAKTFDLINHKLDITEFNKLKKDEYFKTVSPDDEMLLEYLKTDVLVTYELLMKVIELSGLAESDFIKCPTVASLSMRIFRTNMPQDFKTICESYLYKRDEEFIRKGYHGGRVEVFKNYIEDGYHYDINSLYPSVMLDKEYPVGDCSTTKRVGESIGKNEILTNEILFDWKRIYDYNNFFYMIECEVTAPDTNIGLLPIKKDSKLIFPVGTFIGIWTNIELNYAISHGVTINKIFQMCHWRKKAKVFKNFVEKFKTMKEESTGAKRTFAKLIQNSLYGKFGMIRERIVYENYKEEKRIRIEAKGGICARVYTVLKQDLIKYTKFFVADYIKPQFSVFVTAYSRIELLNTMLQCEKMGAQVYYCDTDSLVIDKPLPESICSFKEYGKWKLERKVKKGFYLLPKLYAEIDEETEEEVLKSKGIIQQHMKNISFFHYIKFYYNMVRGKDHIVYDETSDNIYYNRYKIIQVLKTGKDFDDKILLKKRFIFSDKTIHKRIFDFENNSSKPIKIIVDKT